MPALRVPAHQGPLWQKTGNAGWNRVEGSRVHIVNVCLGCLVVSAAWSGLVAFALQAIDYAALDC
eukprot:64281-Heterocapsa_arctica.AAC.1